MIYRLTNEKVESDIVGNQITFTKVTQIKIKKQPKN